MLGRLIIGFLSTPYVELRFERVSKCPDRFSRKVDCISNPESFRDILDIGVNGKGGNDVDVGESLGEGGELPFVDLLVDGRSAIRWLLGAKNALNTGG